MPQQSNPIFRKAELRDIDAIARLWELLQSTGMAFENRIQTASDAKKRIMNDLPLWLKSDECFFWVAEQDTKLIGYIAAFIWLPEPIFDQMEEIFIRDLFVLPEFRQQNIGGSLVNAVEDWGNRCNISRFRLGALSAHPQALEFWKKRGFIPLYTIMLKEGRN